MRVYNGVHELLKTFQVALLTTFKKLLFLAFIFYPKLFKKCLAIEIFFEL